MTVSDADRQAGWDITHMEHALLWACRSKDPSTRVGAVIVDPATQHQVSQGYNGLPRGIPDDPEFLADRNRKYPTTAHAERNALDHRESSVRGFTVYVTMFPCSQCASSLLQSGITRVVSLNHAHKGWAQERDLALWMFQQCGVDVHFVLKSAVDQHLLKRAGLE